MLITAADGFLEDEKKARSTSEDARNEKSASDVTFSLMVERHSRLMYQIAFSLLRNAHDAEDAVQEAFMKLYRNKAFRHMKDEKAFLARTVWRVSVDRLPRRHQPLDASHDQLADTGDSPEKTAMKQAQAASLRRLMDALPEQLRQVLFLSAIQDLNSREVGRIIGIPEGTVRSRLAHAREELRKRFEAADRSGR